MPTDVTPHTHEVGAYAVGLETSVAFAFPNAGQAPMPLWIDQIPDLRIYVVIAL